MYPSPSATAPLDYTGASALSKLCLPQTYKDSNRRLAWANSICVLFLVIGCLGLKPPPVHVRPLPEVVEVIPVELPPPEEPPKTQVTEEQPEPEPTAEVMPEKPVVATAVVANSEKIAFAVPTLGVTQVIQLSKAARRPLSPFVRRPRPRGIRLTTCQASATGAAIRHRNTQAWPFGWAIKAP